MTEQLQDWSHLEPDLADRMRRALRVSGVAAGDMADYIGVRREAVSTWLSGRIVPRDGTLRLWALRTGVPFEWLKSGAVPGHPGGPTPPAKLPHLDSNQEPSGYASLQVRRSRWTPVRTLVRAA